MAILGVQSKETDAERSARRLREKQHGRPLAKLRVLTTDKRYDGHYLYQRVKGYGIPMDLIERELPDLYDKIQTSLKEKAEEEMKAKAEEVPAQAQEKREAKPETKPETKAKRGRPKTKPE